MHRAQSLWATAAVQTSGGSLLSRMASMKAGAAGGSMGSSHSTSLAVAKLGLAMPVLVVKSCTAGELFSRRSMAAPGAGGGMLGDVMAAVRVAVEVRILGRGHNDWPRGQAGECWVTSRQRSECAAVYCWVGGDVAIKAVPASEPFPFFPSSQVSPSSSPMLAWLMQRLTPKRDHLLLARPRGLEADGTESQTAKRVLTGATNDAGLNK